MKQEQPKSPHAEPLSMKAAAIRITIVLLLFTVAGLFTLAKNGQYYPKSNPAQHVSASIKMCEIHLSAQVAEEPLQPVARIFFLEHPPVYVRQFPVEQPPLIPPIGIVVSMQFRSPPASFA